MRADRLLSIMLLLQTRGKTTAQALAEELEVSRRTILRDIDALSFAGVPIYAEGGHGGGFTLDENYRSSLTGLKESEVSALFLADNSPLLNDVGLGKAAESTLLKLFAALPSIHQPSVDDIRQRILIDPLWWWHEHQPMPFWDELQQAVYEDRCIEVTYEHYNGTRVERIIEPYSLVAKASLWYLIGRREGELRTYRISRFHEVRLMDTHFRRYDGFDLPSYWREHVQEFLTNLSEVSFTLRFNSNLIHSNRWSMPGRSEVVQTADQDGWISVRFFVESLDLATMFVFGLGSDVIVVEPPELKTMIIQTAQKILENHRGQTAE